MAKGRNRAIEDVDELEDIGAEVSDTDVQNTIMWEHP